MSRGPGQVQQAILAVFEGRETENIGYWTIRDRIIGIEPTAAQLAAFSRALWGLHRNRRLACQYINGDVWPARFIEQYPGFAPEYGGQHMWHFSIPQKNVVYTSWDAMLTDDGWVDIDWGDKAQKAEAAE